METLTATPMTNGLTSRTGTVSDFPKTRGSGVLAIAGIMAR